MNEPMLDFNTQSFKEEQAAAFQSLKESKAFNPEQTEAIAKAIGAAILVFASRMHVPFHSHTYITEEAEGHTHKFK
jgi:hypothetical protein